MQAREGAYRGVKCEKMMIITIITRRSEFFHAVFRMQSERAGQRERDDGKLFVLDEGEKVKGVEVCGGERV